MELEQILAAVARHGLELRAEGARVDFSGLDFIAVHADDAGGQPWIVRQPRRPDVVAAAAHERRVLDLVRNRLPVSVPDWRIWAPEVIAYPRLPGTPAMQYDPNAGLSWYVDPSAPAPAFVEGLAELLVALHAIEPTTELRVESSAAARAEMRQRMEKTRAALAPADKTWQRWQRWLAADELWTDELVVSHGDLHGGHLLCDEERHITGVLDWTEGKLADPALDLVFVAGMFGREVLERVVQSYLHAGGRPRKALVEQALERWHAVSVVMAAWALEHGDETVLANARAALAAAEAA